MPDYKVGQAPWEVDQQPVKTEYKVGEAPWEVDKSQMGLPERGYAGAENLAMSGLQKVGTVLSPLAKVSEAGIGLAKKGFEKKMPIASKIWETIANTGIAQTPLSDVLPGVYSETGEGFKLQKGGLLDPSYKSAQETMAGAVIDPMNVAVPLGLKGLTRATSGARKAVTKLSGVPKRAAETLAKNYDKIESMAASGVDGIPSQLQQTVKTTLDDAIDVAGKDIGNSIAKAGGVIDINKVVEPFYKLLDDAERAYKSNPAPSNLEKIRAIEENIEHYFATSNIDPVNAMTLKRQMAEIAEFQSKGQKGLLPRGEKLPRIDQEIMKAGSDAYAELNRQFDGLVNKMPELRAKYSELKTIQKELNPLMKDTQTTFKNLKTLNNKGKEIIRKRVSEIDAKLGTKIGENVDLLEAYTYFADPSLMPISTGGVTSTSRSILSGLLGGTIGGAVGSVVGAPQLGAVLGSSAGSMAMSPAGLKGLTRIAQSPISKGAYNLGTAAMSPAALKTIIPSYQLGRNIGREE